jgi:prevent-host-death family protein
MIERGIRQARKEFSDLVKQVQEGEEVLLTHRGSPVARMVPAEETRGPALSSLEDLRAAIHMRGRPLSETVGGDREGAS